MDHTQHNGGGDKGEMRDPRFIVTSLIASAVIGKIDVRRNAANHSIPA